MCLWPHVVLTATCPDLRRATSPNHRARRLTETLSDLRVVIDTEAWPLGRWLTHHPGHWPLFPQHCPRPRSRRGCLPCDHCPDLITWRWRPHHPSSRSRLASAWTLMRRRQTWSVRSVSRRSHEARRRSHRPWTSHVRRRPETRRWRMMRMGATASQARVTSRGKHASWTWTSESKWRRPHTRGRPGTSHPEWHGPWHSHEWRSTSHPGKWESRKPWPSSKVSASSKTLKK